MLFVGGGGTSPSRLESVGASCMSRRLDEVNPQSYVLRTVTNGQREQWDQFVNEHPCGHLLQSWGWGELKASVGWHPLRLALWDTQQQHMVAAAQVLRRGGAHVPLWAGHLAYIPKGPVLDWSQPWLCDALFTQLHSLLRRQGALAVRMEPEAVNSESMTKRLAALRFQPAPAIQPLRTILLDLSYDEESLLARMKEKWRYNVRLAGRKGVTVRMAQTLEDVQAWYGLLQTTSERD